MPLERKNADELGERINRADVYEKLENGRAAGPDEIILRLQNEMKVVIDWMNELFSWCERRKC